MSNGSLPRRISFERLCEILVGYLNAGAADRYAGASEVAEKCPVLLEDISRNNKFFKGWSFIEESPEKTEKGKYKLVPEIAQFASAYRLDPDSEQARQILEAFLSKNEIIATFVERIKSESLDRGTVVASLPRLTGDLTADKAGLNSFTDMLIYAFKLEGLEAPMRPPVPPVRRVKRRRERAIRAPPTSYPPVILSISPDIPLEKFKALIRAFYEAYDDHLRKKASEE